MTLQQLIEDVSLTRSLLGGVLLGLGGALAVAGFGRVVGVSGMLVGAMQGKNGQRAERLASLLGLLATGALAARVAPDALPGVTPALWLTVVAGILVGVGARLANGCTSGHSIMGLGRLSPRSVVASALFAGVGMIVVAQVPASLQVRRPTADAVMEMKAPRRPRRARVESCVDLAAPEITFIAMQEAVCDAAEGP